MRRPTTQQGACRDFPEPGPLGVTRHRTACNGQRKRHGKTLLAEKQTKKRWREGGSRRRSRRKQPVIQGATSAAWQKGIYGRAGDIRSSGKIQGRPGQQETVSQTDRQTGGRNPTDVCIVKLSWVSASVIGAPMGERRRGGEGRVKGARGGASRRKRRNHATLLGWAELDWTGQRNVT